MKFARKEFQKNQFGRRDQKLEELSCGTCFTNRNKVGSCQKLKIMNKWASDDDGGQNLR